MSNGTKVQELKDQIDEYFGDTSVPRGTTKVGLESVLGHVQTLLETLNDEESTEEGEDDDD